MIRLIRRWWNYLTAKLNSSFNEMADPAVQLEQALREAQDQHRRLKEQAANVIASQKQAELRLNKRISDLEKLNANARQALVMAADAERKGDAAKAAQLTSAAETIATQLIQAEKDVGDLKALVLQTTQASDQAKAAVQQNSRVLQQKLAERAKLLSQLEQAKMQEQMNKAMATLNEAVGEDVPTLNEVRDKIEARYAKAKAMAELNEGTVDASIREIEAATANAAAQDRLAELKAELGLQDLDSLGSGSTPQPDAAPQPGPAQA
jgi:phage shock protein A